MNNPYKMLFLPILKLEWIAHYKNVFLILIIYALLCHPETTIGSNLGAGVKNCSKQNYGCIIHKNANDCNSNPLQNSVSRVNRSYGSFVIALSRLEDLVLKGSTPYEYDINKDSSTCKIYSDDAILTWDWDMGVIVTDFDHEWVEIVTINWQSIALYFSSESHPISLRLEDHQAKPCPSCAQAIQNIAPGYDVNEININKPKKL